MYIKSCLMANVLTSALVNLLNRVSPQHAHAAGGCVTRSPASAFVLRRQSVLRVMRVREKPSAITLCWDVKAATVHRQEPVKETRASATSPPASARESRIIIKARFLMYCSHCWSTEESCVSHDLCGDLESLHQ